MRRLISILIVLLCFINCESKKAQRDALQENYNSSLSEHLNEEEIAIDEKEVKKPMDFREPWDEEKASEIVLALLNQELDSIKNDYIHMVKKFVYAEYPDRMEAICIAFSKPKGYDCHACGGELSFIEFIKESDVWKTGNKFLRTLDWGQWGDAYVDDWELTEIGEEKYGFIVEYGGSGQGYVESYLDVFTIIDDEFRILFSDMVGFSDEGAFEIPKNSYGSEIEIVKNNRDFYDLSITTEGLKDKKDFKEINYYTFDGKGYTSVGHWHGDYPKD